MKIKIKPLDKLYSHWIRWIRDKGICQRCLKQYQPPTAGLQCSHFHGRRKQSVRFDPDNTVSLCFSCHQFLGENPEDHRSFMLKRLGQLKYDLLMLRANTPNKPDVKGIKLWLETAIRYESDGILGRKA